MTMPQQRAKINLSETEIKAFWKRVDCSNGPESCWEWQRYTPLLVNPHKNLKPYTANPYGKFAGLLAHRIAYHLTYGLKHENDSLYCVKHICNNKLCCNPKHLIEDTQSNNHNDAINDGLSNQNGIGILTNEHVKNILWILNYQWNCHTVTKLSKLYGVSPMTIRYIKSRKTWKHILTPLINDIPPGPKLK